MLEGEGAVTINENVLQERVVVAKMKQH